ncbi:helix-turn-helix domain-containing protein [Desulfopila inferna]|uniref:helix-turn-helix domain-containing protein n=1 Tax=Desulfopila inferna TaxID=468528 RepID=UPI001965CDF1|nr:cupin domain-containing protein [Desulfopila inferna]MBM9603731.1 cupin domain-containing protein [Desulfopila inferna]
MPENTNSVAEKIKSLRKAQRLSLEELSRQSGISETLLREMESDKISPPLGNIINLAKVFEVPVGDFFGDSGDSPFCITRSGDRATVTRFGSTSGESNGYSYQGLGQQKRNRQMEPFLVTLNPADPRKVEPNQHIGEEFIFVLQGKVEVSILDHKDVLNPGDSMYYDSNVPHKISAHGDEPATILAVIYAKEEMIIL